MDGGILISQDWGREKIVFWEGEHRSVQQKSSQNQVNYTHKNVRFFLSVSEEKLWL